MTQISKGLSPQKINRTCVLYDKQSGDISHIQHAVVFKGGHEPTDQEIEGMARRSLEKRGLGHANLHALHMPGEQMQPFKAYRVDVDKKALVEIERTRKPISKK